MENKGLTVILGIIVAVGSLVVYVIEAEPDLRAIFDERQQYAGENEVDETDITDDENDEAQPNDEAEENDAVSEEEIEGEQEAEEQEGDLAHDGTFAVSASHPVAVEVGMEVLEAGGNAIDAAIAVSYALGVVEPFGSGIGGGGSMLVQEIGVEPVAYNYRETSPLNGQIHDLGIGVPGFVQGMETIYEEKSSGTFSLEALIQPSVELAQTPEQAAADDAPVSEEERIELEGFEPGDGVEVSEILHDRLQAAAYRMPIYDAQVDLEHFYRVEQGTQTEEAVRPGEILYQRELADTLALIRDEGAQAFYDGPITERLLTVIDEFEAEDFQAYEVNKTAPVQGEFAGYTVLSAPAPLSGVPLIQILQLVDHIDERLGEQGLIFEEVFEPDSVQFVHTLTTLTRMAYDERRDHIGDPAFEEVQAEELTSEAYTNELLDEVLPELGIAELHEEDQAGLGQQFHAGLSASASTTSMGKDFAVTDLEKVLEVDDFEMDEEGMDTTHFVIVDEEGTMVSATNTLSNFFGSGFYVDGFFLNDQLTNFATDNPVSPNYPEPGKQPRSFIAPTILTNNDGEPIMGIGSPGGSRIPAIMAQVLTRWAKYDFDEDDKAMVESILAPRFFYENGQLSVETDIPGSTVRELENVNFDYGEINVFDHITGYGNISALGIDHDSDRMNWFGDPRRNSYGDRSR